MGKVKYVIKTCEKYRQTRLETCFNTWAKDLDKNDYFILSDLTNLDVTEGHDGLTTKMRRFFKFSQIDNHWILICDDDSYVNVNNVNNLVSTLNDTHPNIIGNKIMPTRQRGQIDNSITSSDDFILCAQPKISCQPFASGVLMSPLVFSIVQLMVQMNYSNDDIIADDQWLTAVFEHIRYVNRTNSGTAKYKYEVNNKFASTKKYSQMSIDEKRQCCVVSCGKIPMIDIHKEMINQDLFDNVDV